MQERRGGGYLHLADFLPWRILGLYARPDTFTLRAFVVSFQNVDNLNYDGIFSGARNDEFIEVNICGLLSSICRLFDLTGQ